MSGERDTPDGRTLYLARPIVAEPVCLECHSTPGRAPAAMIRIYGPDHGFGWKENEVIGAQIASVPMSVPMAMAKKSFRELMISLAGVGLLTLLVLDAALVMVVIRPVVRLSKLADRVSKGETDVPDLPAQGSDEIAQLGRSFGRMSVSLNKAMKMLEE